MIRRVNTCVKSSGGHFEHILRVAVFRYSDGLLDICLYGQFTLFWCEDHSFNFFKYIYLQRFPAPFTAAFQLLLFFYMLLLLMIFLLLLLLLFLQLLNILLMRRCYRHLTPSHDLIPITEAIRGSFRTSLPLLLPLFLLLLNEAVAPCSYRSMVYIDTQRYHTTISAVDGPPLPSAFFYLGKLVCRVSPESFFVRHCYLTNTVPSSNIRFTYYRRYIPDLSIFRKKWSPAGPR